MFAVIAIFFAPLSFGQGEDQGRRQPPLAQQPTPYFAAEYTLHHISLDPVLLKNFSTGYYEAGHMMYIDEKSLGQMRTDIGKFIQSSINR